MNQMYTLTAILDYSKLAQSIKDAYANDFNTKLAGKLDDDNTLCQLSKKCYEDNVIYYVEITYFCESPDSVGKAVILTDNERAEMDELIKSTVLEALNVL